MTVDESRFAKQFVGPDDFQQYLPAAFSYLRKLDLARSYEKNVRRRLMRTVDNLAFPVLLGGGDREML